MTNNLLFFFQVFLIDFVSNSFLVFLGLGFNLGQFHTNKAICGVLQKCLSVWVCQCVCVSMCVCVNKTKHAEVFPAHIDSPPKSAKLLAWYVWQAACKKMPFSHWSISWSFRRCSLLACNNYNYNYLCVLPPAGCVQGACNTKFMYKYFSWDWPSLQKPGSIFNIFQCEKNSTQLSSSSLFILFTILHNLLCSTVLSISFSFRFHIHSHSQSKYNVGLSCVCRMCLVVVVVLCCLHWRRISFRKLAWSLTRRRAHTAPVQVPASAQFWALWKHYPSCHRSLRLERSRERREKFRLTNWSAIPKARKKGYDLTWMIIWI